MTADDPGFASQRDRSFRVQKNILVSGIRLSDRSSAAILAGIQQRWPRYTNPVDLASMKKTDPLIQALLDCEPRLCAWINESALNADLFRRDPLTAIRTANVGVDERLLSEFEETVTRLALKLDVG